MATNMAFFSSPLRVQNIPFTFLFVFRYVRLIGNLIGFWIYKPTPIPAHPTLYPHDVTVIIPTVDPQNSDFCECVASVLENHPGEIIVVSGGGAENFRLAREVCSQYSSPSIRVVASNQANKRHQVTLGINLVKTSLVCLVDDHVFWPSTNFLRHLVAPFEDDRIGVVGTNKRVRREPTGVSARSFWNMIGCLYLERHNFEIRATNAIDGGVFVVSGRTAAYRTCILREAAPGFCSERFFFGLFGPLNADDDNYLTRLTVRMGYKVKIQYSTEAMIETTLGTYPKFLLQCLRWVRTTWRSNPASLRDLTVWRTQPWCLYAVFVTSFFNFALLYDAGLFWTLSQTSLARQHSVAAFTLLAVWIVASKLVKPFPHFWRHPADLVFLPWYVVFGYAHSLIKLYALFTFYETSWSGRTLTDGEGDCEEDEASPLLDDGSSSVNEAKDDGAKC